MSCINRIWITTVAGLVLSIAPFAHADFGDQLFKLLGSDGGAGDDFGVSVAIRVETAIIGALGDDDNGDSSGSAYLFDAAGVPGQCLWDLDGDDLVGTGDLIVLLGAWGTGPPDFNGSGTVGMADLMILLGNWGPCP